MSSNESKVQEGESRRKVGVQPTTRIRTPARLTTDPYSLPFREEGSVPLFVVRTLRTECEGLF